MVNDELKANILDRYVQVKTELEKLFRKYGAENFQELEKRFCEIPEEEGHDDYFIAQNLEALRRKLHELLASNKTQREVTE